MRRRVPLQRKILQAKILATPVQHTIRDNRRAALVEWSLEMGANRALSLPHIIRPENLWRRKTANVENRGDRNDGIVQQVLQLSPGLSGRYAGRIRNH